MAHRKSGGSTRLGRDSISKRLGTKVTTGQSVNAGAVLVRQRGTKIQPGLNTRKGNDDTIYAVKTGKVNFATRKIKKYDGKLKATKFVSVRQ